LMRQLGAAVDQARLFGAVLHGLARDFVVVRLVGLAEVGGVGVGNGACLLHPEQGGAGVETAGESDADFLLEGEVLKNGGHGEVGVCGSAEVADVVIWLCNPNLETAVGRNVEALTRAGTQPGVRAGQFVLDRKSTRLNSSHVKSSYAVL